jgi:hypothetical protein
MAFKNIKNDYNRGNSFLSYFVSGKNKQYHSQQFSDAAIIPPITATGGTIITFGDYTIHSFPGGSLGSSNPYSFVLSSDSRLPTTNFDIILVAGGGSGGDDQPGAYGGGGGGAGGVRFIPQISLVASTYPISVGGGGANSPSAPASGANGQPTVFNSPNGNSIPAITSDGGGWGGAGGGGTGNPGGSGGGKDYPGPVTNFGAGNSNLGNTPEPRASGPTSPIGDTKYQGSPGNGTANDSSYSGGGGGGARYSPPTYYQSPITGPGITVPAPAASFRAQGGDGIDLSPIVGPYATNGFGDSNIPSQAWFGGGGHGGQYPGGTGAPGTGGKGGGGNSPANAQSNTGGGGGVLYGNGGPGIVFIRYKTYGGPTGS